MVQKMSNFFRNASDFGLGFIILVFFLLGNFPGGTILMALSCGSRVLDGWDWVLSVIIPFYGFFKSASCIL